MIENINVILRVVKLMQYDNVLYNLKVSVGIIAVIFIFRILHDVLNCVSSRPILVRTR